MSESNGKLYCHINCGKETNKLCVSCQLPFCEAHESEFDRSYCSDCVSISNTIVTSKPLVDDEEVTHKGRQLVLTGEAWMRSRDVIAKMTDQELAAKLEALKEAVHEAEMVLDFRRIVYSQVENEQSSRLSRKLSRLRLISAVGEAHKIEVSTNKGVAQDAKSNLSDALKALKQMGLNKDAIANVLLKLNQQQKAKENQR